MQRVAVEPGDRVGADGRFELVRQLGAGGFGTVYEAVDTRYECRLALKVLRRDRPTDIQRFKQEFRGIAEVVHRNLVRFYELATDGDLWFLTMELVDGCSFVEYVTGVPGRVAITEDLGAPAAPVVVPHGQVDPARVRDAILQLAEAVHVVHEAGKLHCDIKPSNVLVTPEGRVVLLDFGLVTDLDGGSSRALLGTPGYMSPEQATGRPATTASDWFSVGVMLGEALGPGADDDLDALRRGLTAADPTARPSGPDVIRRLRGTTVRHRDETHVLGRRLGFVGRRAELEQLERHLEGVFAHDAPAIARVVGASGMGKSELVRHFLGQVRRDHPDALILSNRCYEHDSVPYKAIDGVIDTLGEYLAANPGERADVAAIAQLFPSLAVARDPEIAALDQQAVRRRAFQALRTVLASIGKLRPVVVFLDDLQWADADSAWLLADVLRPPTPPRLLMIASHRPDGATGVIDVLDELARVIPQITIDVGELSALDATSLAETAVGSDPALIETIVREAEGSPIFIRQLAQQAALVRRAPGVAFSFRDVIGARLDGLEDDARKLVETIAIAGRPIPERIATRAAHLEGAAARLATMLARHTHFITTRTVANAVFVESAHDRVRAAITSTLTTAAAKDCHARLAETLLREPDPEPEPLVDHLLAAGDETRAREFAVASAERADRVYAFDRAAHYYALILRLTGTEHPDRPDLVARWAEALANAGRSGEAAEAFDQAAGLASEPGRKRQLARRAAELSLRSGRLEVGTRQMSAVLDAVGIAMPKTRARAGMLSIARRLRLFVRGTRFAPQDPPPEVRERLDALWSASSGVSMVNHVLADALGVQHLLLALRAGAKSNIVRGLGYEAAFEAVIGGSFLRKRCARLLGEMDALANESPDPYDRAWARMSRGITSWFDGDWATTFRECDEAAAIYREQCRGVSWELVVCDAYRLPSLAYIGDLPKLAHLVPIAYEAARERGDLYGAATLQLGQHCLVDLAGDRANDVIEYARDAIGRFPSEIYLLPHYHHLLAFAQAELYRGNPERALERVEREWKGLEKSRLSSVQCLRVEIRHLYARAAIATAAAHANRRDELLRVARAQALRIAKDRIAPAGPLAKAILAGIAVQRDDREGARALLEKAHGELAAANMGLYACAARMRLAALTGGDAGRAMNEEAAAWLTARGIKNPEAMSRMLVP